MKIYIVCIGKIKEKFYTDAIAEYLKRMTRYGKVEIVELAEAQVLRPNIADIKLAVDKESDSILANIKGISVLLDIGGKLITSEDLANMVAEVLPQGKDMTFVIGGSHGVNDLVRNAVNYRISFGRVTYPHQLMRVILAEQIYRAHTILQGTPYHK